MTTTTFHSNYFHITKTKEQRKFMREKKECGGEEGEKEGRIRDEMERREGRWIGRSPPTPKRDHN